jgi:pSer/pThr/pTyr-binding forkhead associated (FHA) protein
VVEVVPLRVEAGEHSYVFVQPEVTIGRVSDADVVVETPDVSRIHGRVQWIDGRWRYTDNSSRNGTYVSGTKRNDIAIEGSVIVNLAGASGPEITLLPATDLITAPVGRITLGRAADNDVVVDDAGVSRHHAIFHCTAAGGLEITDLGSHNGTFVNGDRIDQSSLEEGDKVTIGGHSFVVADGTLRQL